MTRPERTVNMKVLREIGAEVRGRYVNTRQYSPLIQLVTYPEFIALQEALFSLSEEIGWSSGRGMPYTGGENSFIDATLIDTSEKTYIRLNQRGKMSWTSGMRERSPVEPNVWRRRRND